MSTLEFEITLDDKPQERIQQWVNQYYDSLASQCTEFYENKLIHYAMSRAQYNIECPGNDFPAANEMPAPPAHGASAADVRAASDRYKKICKTKGIEKCRCRQLKLPWWSMVSRR